METEKEAPTTEETTATLEETTDQSEAVEIETKKAAKKAAASAPVAITYFDNAKVTCNSCGTAFTVGSTKPEIHVEVCSNCHPFFTGKAKFVDTEGRVEAFQRRAAAQTERKEKKVTEKSPERPKSLKEMLELIEKS